MLQKRKYILSISAVCLWAIMGYIFTISSRYRLHTLDFYAEWISYVMLSIGVLAIYYVTIKKTLFLYHYIFLIMGIFLLVSLLELMIIQKPLQVYYIKYKILEETIDYYYKWNIIGILSRNASVFGACLLIFYFQKIAQIAKLKEESIIHKMQLAEEKEKRLESDCIAQRLQYEALLNKNDAHFFFNVMNNLVAFAHQHHEKTKLYIAHFAHIYRYIMALEIGEKVMLQKDVDYLKAFFELEKMRIDKMATNISFSENITEKQLMIQPLLFESFVENAFKYYTHESNGFLRVWVDTPDACTVRFVSTNTYHEEDRMIIHKKSSQKGLQFIKERLDFLCEKDYSLTIDDNTIAHIFSVTLIISVENDKTTV